MTRKIVACGISLFLAACYKSESPALVTENPLNWHPPESVGALRLVSTESSADLQGFQDLSAAELCRGKARELIYSHSSGSGVRVSVRFLQHSSDQVQRHYFDGIWHKLFRDCPSGTLAMERRSGQNVLVWTGSSSSGGVRGFGWLSRGSVIVLILSNASSGGDDRILCDHALRVSPSMLTDSYQVSSSRDFLTQEIDKLVDLMTEESLREQACLRIAGLTFFLPEGVSVDTPDITCSFVEQFPRWWVRARRDSQIQWLRERIARETARVIGTSSLEYPCGRFRLTLSLETVAGVRFPPSMLVGPKDLLALKDHWSRFAERTAALPRDQWVREAINVWITWLESPASRAKRASETASDMLDLKRLLECLPGIPSELLALPVLDSSRDSKRYNEDLDRYCVSLKAWWKDKGQFARPGRYPISPLFEESGNPTVVRE